MRHWKYLIFVLLLTVFFTSHFGFFASAEGEVKIDVTPGFDGWYKFGAWTPVKVKIINQSQDNIEGDLIIEAGNQYDFSGTYYKPVTIASNTMKEVTLTIPAQGIIGQTKVKLIQNEKEVASAKIEGRAISNDALFIGVLASDKDTGNFLATLKMNSKRATEITPLNKENIPTSVNGLKGLDMIIINNYALDNLQQEQIETIIQWTKKGGTLVLGGGSQYFKSFNDLQSILPVQVNGTIKIKNLSNLEQVAKKELFINNDLTLSNAKALKDSEILYDQNGIPLFVSKEVEGGNVLYVAYDLSDEPLASWSGNNELWNHVVLKMNLNYNQQGQIYPTNNWWALRNAVERIPSLKLPSILTLVILFGAYILLVGPILYFVLKRREKRELNWIIIPILSVVIAFGVYQIAFYNRGTDVMLHNVSYLQLKDKQSANLSTVSGIFVPKGGTYTLKAKEVDMAVPIMEGYNEQSFDNWVLVNDDETMIQFKKVGFWSFRRAYIETEINNLGGFDSNLSYNDGKLTGTIKNNTNLALRDVKLIAGNNIEDIGDLSPGGTTTININYSTMFAPRSNIRSQQLFPSNLQNSQIRYQTRENFMLELINQEWYQLNNSTAPTIIGWSEDQMIDLELDHKNHEDYNLTLVKGSLNIKPSNDGYVFFAPGTFPAILIESPMKTDMFQEGYMVPAGDISFEFTMKKEDFDYEIQKIHLFTWSNDRTTFNKKLYNWNTEQYEDFEKVVTDDNTLEGKMIDQYVSDDGKLRIKMSHSENQHRHLGHPVISVEGRVTKNDTNR